MLSRIFTEFSQPLKPSIFSVIPGSQNCKENRQEEEFRIAEEELRKKNCEFRISDLEFRNSQIPHSEDSRQYLLDGLLEVF